MRFAVRFAGTLAVAVALLPLHVGAAPRDSASQLPAWAASVGFATASQAQGARATQSLTSQPSETLTVFAAASLTAAFQAIATEFQKLYPQVRVETNFAGSPTLVQQIDQGAPADVFAAADEVNMHKLVDSGELAGEPQLFAQNKLQIVVSAGNPKHVATLADLNRSGMIVALCGPTVPCGRYASELFRKAGVALPPASEELDVKAVLSKVVAGEVDAGVVYDTDIRAGGNKVEGIDIPESVDVIARYPIAVLKHAPNKSAAQTFVDFVLSPAGQQVLVSFGFRPR